MPLLRGVTVALVLLAPLLAGCSGNDGTTEATSATPPGTIVQQERYYGAPNWTIGQSWDHQWSLYSGGNVTLQFTARAIVAEDLGDAWTLASDNETIAAYHAAFTFPTLGRFTKSGLTASAEESVFPWYRFPFKMNDTWSETIETFDGVATKVEHKVTATVRDGKAIGVAATHPVVELREGGKLFAQYDYDEKAGWFSKALFYDGEGQLQFLIERLAAGKGFSGTAYDGVGELVANEQFIVAPGVVEGAPVTLFDVPDGNTHVLAFVFAFAATGFQDAELFAPDNTRYGVQAADANGQTVFNDSRQLLVPAQTGTWRFTTAGVGVASGGGLLAYAVQERAITV